MYTCVDSCPFLCAVLSTTYIISIPERVSQIGHLRMLSLQLVRQRAPNHCHCILLHAWGEGHYMYLSRYFDGFCSILYIGVCVRTLPWYATEAC